MKKNKIVPTAIILILALIFIIRFGVPSILRLYVEIGMGNCLSQPILCMEPEEEIIDPVIDQKYLSQLKPYTFPEIEIYLPIEFKAIKENFSKVYYKKKLRKLNCPVAYLLYEKPKFFIGLFPHLTKQDIKDDYEFISRVMNAQLKDIKNLTDAFFIITKGIFTPNLGDQKNLKMIKFKIADKKGFINYNVNETGNYFDCNIIDNNDNFFKVYIKDINSQLDLNKVITIISTLKKQ